MGTDPSEKHRYLRLRAKFWREVLIASSKRQVVIIVSFFHEGVLAEFDRLLFSAFFFNGAEYFLTFRRCVEGFCFLNGFFERALFLFHAASLSFAARLPHIAAASGKDARRIVKCFTNFDAHMGKGGLNVFA
ncbi:MAG: hypothetical protein AAFY83_05715, partial [Pseudomonadota bacterium]